MERETLTWTGFDDATARLAENVVESGYRPDVILAIARGGLLIAGALAYALSVKNVYVMNIEFYTGVDERLPLPIVLPPALNVVDIKDTRLLIADDIADTGHTIATVQRECGHAVAEMRSAVLYEKDRSEVKCDYVWRRTGAWINFPWSTREPVAGAAVQTT